jgi:hypothetical protein
LGIAILNLKTFAPVHQKRAADHVAADSLLSTNTNMFSSLVSNQVDQATMDTGESWRQS